MKHYYQNLIKVCRQAFMIILLFAAAGKLSAQVYINGNLGTGPVSKNGTNAPAGTQWHELQNNTGNNTESNTVLASNHTGNFTLADDFIVPAGPSWNITKMTFYAIQPGSTLPNSPITGIRVRIHSSNPFAGPTTIVFGDLTTNRLLTSNFSNVYGIFNSLVPAPNTPTPQYPVWAIEANVSVTLAPGTYWVEWQTVSPAANYSPLSAIVGARTQPGYNGIQSNLGVWAAIIDGGNPASAPDVAEDAVYKIDYSTGACAGTPAPGNTIASLASACPGINVNLSLQNLTPGSGVTYQWQSASAVGGPYSNIAGATNSTLTTTITGDTYFQALVTCAGNTGTSTPVLVSLTPASGCYCTAGSPDVIFEKISRVQYNTIDNPSTSTAGYENFTAITTTVVQQSTVPITVTIAGPFATDQVIVWIDFNQNGSFTDPGERVYISAAGNGPHTGNITIPATSLLGPTRMRIRMHDSGLGPNATPCGNSAYGQVEDYTVNITPCIPVTITAQPANATIQCGGNATFSLTATGSGPAYQWQERTSATALWTNLSNVGVYSGVTTSTLTITGAPVSMNGYQYRAVFSGYCRSTDFTTPATLTVNPLVATVNPPSATICNGATQQLTITNITSPQPFSTNVASGPIAVPIPDNLVSGATHTLNVATVPAAAVITGMSVRFTIPHTYSGDLVIALKAPNGAVLNLDYYVTTTFPGGNGFLNTRISSATGLGALSSGTAPYTGTFRPDAQIAATGNGPSGPTGYAATVGNFAGLYTTGASANGTWTIAMYDGGAIDVGTLTSWDITIDYLAGIPATGVWGPTTPTNTIFTDPAGTIPYVPGTPLNTVYVHPTTTTTYTVVVTTPICVSGVTNIPVTVANPLGAITGPTNQAICTNGNATFTVSAASGNPIVYQWQVSTDGGGTWTNIANAGVYTGATTGTLTLTGVPITFNNYQYRAILSVAACSSTTTSAAATLTVNPLPVVVINAGPTTQLYPGITTTLTAAVSPNAAASYQWYHDGIAVPGATAATIVVDVDGLGDYSVSVVDVNGCEGSSNSISVTAAKNDIMFIYPSPTTGIFQVRFYSAPGNNQIPRSVTIYDSKGARVYTQTFNINVPYGKIEVDMTNHAKGIYRVELSDRSGNRLKTGSVLIL